MRRIEARRKNASAFRLRFSQSLASLRQRLSHAIVRSTIQRLGNTSCGRTSNRLQSNTGGETDVCVLSTMLGAVDWGFRVILVTDALCSSADETHDAMMNVYMNRFGEQVETVTTDTLPESWPTGARGRRV